MDVLLNIDDESQCLQICASIDLVDKNDSIGHGGVDTRQTRQISAEPAGQIAFGDLCSHVRRAPLTANINIIRTSTIFACAICGDDAHGTACRSVVSWAGMI
jgi:hypothetical protein